MACTIKRGSYASLQSALAHHGMVFEYVSKTTCVTTTSRPLSIDSPMGRIGYRHVKRNVFFGYRQEVSGKQEAYIALPEKALLDLLYLTPGSDDAAYIEELRLQASEQLDTLKMMRMAERFGAPRLLRAVEHLDRHLNSSDRGGSEMKDQIQNLIAEAKTVPEALLLVREYLQALVFEALQRGGRGHVDEGACVGSVEEIDAGIFEASPQRG